MPRKSNEALARDKRESICVAMLNELSEKISAGLILNRCEVTHSEVFKNNAGIEALTHEAVPFQIYLEISAVERNGLAYARYSVFVYYGGKMRAVLPGAIFTSSLVFCLKAIVEDINGGDWRD